MQIRVGLLALVGVLAATEVAEAAPRGRWQPRPRVNPARFPRIAAIERAILRTPPTFPNRPLSSAALSTGFTTLSLAGRFATQVTLSAGLQAVANGGPQVLRLARLLLVGSPTPGRPLDTALWVASPTLLTVRYTLQELRWLRRGVRYSSFSSSPPPIIEPMPPRMSSGPRMNPPI